MVSQRRGVNAALYHFFVRLRQTLLTSFFVSFFLSAIGSIIATKA